mgnify:CR=1 FL=1
MIDRLQQHLSDIYQVDGLHDVRDYLITDPRLARCIGAGSMQQIEKNDPLGVGLVQQSRIL